MLAIFPERELQNIPVQTVSSINNYLRETEHNAYILAKTKEEYCNKLAMKVREVQFEMMKRNIVKGQVLQDNIYQGTHQSHDSSRLLARLGPTDHPVMYNRSNSREVNFVSLDDLIPKSVIDQSGTLVLPDVSGQIISPQQQQSQQHASSLLTPPATNNAMPFFHQLTSPQGSNISGNCASVTGSSPQKQSTYSHCVRVSPNERFNSPSGHSTDSQIPCQSLPRVSPSNNNDSLMSILSGPRSEEAVLTTPSILNNVLQSTTSSHILTELSTYYSGSAIEKDVMLHKEGFSHSTPSEASPGIAPTGVGEYLYSSYIHHITLYRTFLIWQLHSLQFHLAVNFFDLLKIQFLLYDVHIEYVWGPGFIMHILCIFVNVL